MSITGRAAYPRVQEAAKAVIATREALYQAAQTKTD